MEAQLNEGQIDTARKTVSIKEGQAVKCDASEDTIYRYTNEQLRNYPSTEVASSWTDFPWKNFIVVDCSGIPVGPAMEPQDTTGNKTALSITEGHAVKCDASENTIYRYTNEQLRPFPSPEIASSWTDFPWDDFIVVDCFGIPVGPAMEAQLNDGQAAQLE
jgi:hypothetical protein